MPIMRAKLFLICIGFQFLCIAQEQIFPSFSSIDVNYFAGNIALHNNDILHLITGHPEGVIISWNKKTFGFNTWEQRYNYPDYGVSFSYQNFKNKVLGNNYALYGHYNFYFLNRNLMLRIGQGLAYTSNPYDKETNHKNIAFGSVLMSSTYAMINYKKERVFDKFGFQTGIAFIHYSNANVKAPNTSINSLAINVGLTYNFDNENPEFQYNLSDDEPYKESIKYNFVFRSGVNESDVIASGQYPFYVVSAYADKRLNRKSAIQFGVDAFFSKFLKELIYYQSVGFPENNIDADTDYKRFGVFVGHELFINKLSVVTQFGFYAYYPYDFEGQFYQRIGFKRYLGDKWFAALTLKTHAAKAEAVELGIGIRL
jgi:hypothetical protein